MVVKLYLGVPKVRKSAHDFAQPVIQSLKDVVKNYSPALVANVSTTARLCIKSCGTPCRSSKYAELL